MHLFCFRSAAVGVAVHPSATAALVPGVVALAPAPVPPRVRSDDASSVMRPSHSNASSRAASVGTHLVASAAPAAAPARSTGSAHANLVIAIPAPPALVEGFSTDEDGHGEAGRRHTRLVAERRPATSAGGAGAAAGGAGVKAESLDSDQIDARRVIQSALDNYKILKGEKSISFELAERGSLIIRVEIGVDVYRYLPLEDYASLVCKAADYVNKKVEKERGVGVVFLRVFQVPVTQPSGAKLGDYVSVVFSCSRYGNVVEGENPSRVYPDFSREISFTLCRRGEEIIVLEASEHADPYTDLCFGETTLERCDDASAPLRATRASTPFAASRAVDSGGGAAAAATTQTALSAMSERPIRTRPVPLGGRVSSLFGTTGASSGGAASSGVLKHRPFSSSVGSPS